METPVVLLWAFATCVAAVMMATHVRRRREQLTKQLREHVDRHLNPTGSIDQTAAPDDVASEPQAGPQAGPENGTDPE